MRRINKVYVSKDGTFYLDKNLSNKTTWKEIQSGFNDSFGTDNVKFIHEDKMAAKKRKKKKISGAKKRAKKRTGKKKRAAKGKIPLSILKKRYGKLGRVIMSRGG